MNKYFEVYRLRLAVNDYNLGNNFEDVKELKTFLRLFYSQTTDSDYIFLTEKYKNNQEYKNIIKKFINNNSSLYIDKKELTNITNISITRQSNNINYARVSITNPNENLIVEGDIIEIYNNNSGEREFIGVVTGVDFSLAADLFYSYDININGLLWFVQNTNIVASQALYNQVRKDIKNESSNVSPYVINSDIFNSKSILSILSYIFNLVFFYDPTEMVSHSDENRNNLNIFFDFNKFIGKVNKILESDNTYSFNFFIQMFVLHKYLGEQNIFYLDEKSYNLMTPFILDFDNGFSVMDVTRTDLFSVLQRISESCFSEIIEWSSGTCQFRISPPLSICKIEDIQDISNLNSNIISIKYNSSSDSFKNYIQTKFAPGVVDIDVQNYGNTYSLVDMLRYGLRVEGPIVNPSNKSLSLSSEFAKIYFYISRYSGCNSSIEKIYDKSYFGNMIYSNIIINSKNDANNNEFDSFGITGYCYSETVTLSPDSSLVSNLSLSFCGRKNVVRNSGLSDLITKLNARASSIISTNEGVNSTKIKLYNSSSYITFLEFLPLFTDGMVFAAILYKFISLLKAFRTLAMTKRMTMSEVLSSSIKSVFEYADAGSGYLSLSKLLSYTRLNNVYNIVGIDNKGFQELYKDKDGLFMIFDINTKNKIECILKLENKNYNIFNRFIDKLTMLSISDPKNGTYFKYSGEFKKIKLIENPSNDELENFVKILSSIYDTHIGYINDEHNLFINPVFLWDGNHGSLIAKYQIFLNSLR